MLATLHTVFVALNKSKTRICIAFNFFLLRPSSIFGLCMYVVECNQRVECFSGFLLFFLQLRQNELTKKVMHVSVDFISKN